MVCGMVIYPTSSVELCLERSNIPAITKERGLGSRSEQGLEIAGRNWSCAMLPPLQSLLLVLHCFGSPGQISFPYVRPCSCGPNSQGAIILCCRWGAVLGNFLPQKLVGRLGNVEHASIYHHFSSSRVRILLNFALAFVTRSSALTSWASPEWKEWYSIKPTAWYTSAG
jgi:hypothetical protein